MTTRTLDDAWRDCEAALPEGSDITVSFVANGPDAGWIAAALRPVMSFHDWSGPHETQIAALDALTAKLLGQAK